MSLCRASYYYRSHKDGQEALRMKIRDHAAARVRYGYLRIHVLLRREGLMVNKKRVYRLYCLDNLNLRLKPRKKLVSRPRVEVQKESHPNEGWAMDFVSDQLFNGKRFRTLTVVGTYTRECLALFAGQSIQGTDVVEVLNRLTIERDKPEFIRVDNGPEFISKSLDLWAYTEGVRLQFSRPGKPTVNAFIELFSGSFRDECLETNWFLSLENAKNKLEA
jgi:putative transposase